MLFHRLRHVASGTSAATGLALQHFTLDRGAGEHDTDVASAASRCAPAAAPGSWEARATSSPPRFRRTHREHLFHVIAGSQPMHPRSGRACPGRALSCPSSVSMEPLALGAPRVARAGARLPTSLPSTPVGTRLRGAQCGQCREGGSAHRVRGRRRARPDRRTRAPPTASRPRRRPEGARRLGLRGAGGTQRASPWVQAMMSSGFDTHR